MAVAEKVSPKTKPSSPAQELAISSFIGGIFIFVVVGFLLAGLPLLWSSDFGPDQLFNPYLSTSLLVMFTAVVAAALGYLGHQLEVKHPLPGQRAGSVLFALGLFISTVAGLEVANWLASREQEAWLVIVAGVVVGVGLLAVLVSLYLRPVFDQWLVGLEEQGWLHARAFKPNQGLRVRRGTLISLLVIMGAGVWTAVRNKLFGTGTWDIAIPETDYRLFLLFQMEYTAPLLTFAVLGWFIWRVVNWPVFADFLIATEAEMNKVSWTTRRRLFQDTVVVLVTVILLTLFLFVVDILWIRLLQVPGVLQFDASKAKQKQMAPTEW